MKKIKIYFSFLLTIYLITGVFGAEEKATDNKETKPAKKKKDIRDFNDADIERLFDEWEEGEEEKDEDDLPEHLRPQPKIDLSKIDPSDPEGMLKMTKKGKTLMIFVSVSGNPTKEESEEITQRWQNQLFQANFQLQRYMVSDDRAIFMVTDGSMAFDIKNFLIEQERCLSVTIDQQEYFGRGSDKYEDKKKSEKKKDKKKKDKKSDDKDKKKKDKKDKKEKKDKKDKKEKKEKSMDENKIKKTKDRSDNLILPEDEAPIKTNKAKNAQKTEL